MEAVMSLQREPVARLSHTSVCFRAFPQLLVATGVRSQHTDVCEARITLYERSDTHRFLCATSRIPALQSQSEGGEESLLHIAHINPFFCYNNKYFYETTPSLGSLISN